MGKVLRMSQNKKQPSEEKGDKDGKRNGITAQHSMNDTKISNVL